MTCLHIGVSKPDLKEFAQIRVKGMDACIAKSVNQHIEQNWSCQQLLKRCIFAVDLFDVIIIFTIDSILVVLALELLAFLFDFVM